MIDERMETAYRALLELGLKPYQARVYLALIDGKERTASELVAITNVPQPRIYDTLESLANLGLVEEILSKPRRYRGIPPEEAVNRLVENATRRIVERREQALHALREAAGSQEAPHTLGVKVIKNMAEAVNRARKVVHSSSHDVLIAGPQSFLEEILGGQESLRVGGGKLIAVVSYEEEFAPTVHAPWLGVRKRPVSILPIVIADSRRSLVFRENYALEITDEGLLRMLIDFYYHSLWRVSIPVKKLEAKRGLEYAATVIWLIGEVIRDALDRKLKVMITVDGLDKRNGKHVQLTGSVIELVENSHGVTISIIVRVGERSVSVGGLGARFEDVEGRLFRVLIGE
ncbi:MAG: ArsR family transcriptional regulator [Thermofilum sp.]|jgi:predicted transcriptional regulator|nr:ArsR family transcriptional regulator [Thermofilum sp.]